MKCLHMDKKYVWVLILVSIACQRPAGEMAQVVHAPPRPIVPTILVDSGAIAFDSSLVLRYQNPLLLAFYRASGFQTVWQKKSYRSYFLRHFNAAATDGLDPNDYTIQKLNEFEAQQQLTQEQRVAYDLLLTASLQTYLTHLRIGKLDPKQLYPNWDIQKPPFDVNMILSKALKEHQIESLIAQSTPRSAVYQQLKQALQLLETFTNRKFPPLSYVRTIVPKDTSFQMRNIKKRLYYWKDAKILDTVKNYYNPALVPAVKHFQRRHGLTPDGIIGEGTLHALSYDKSERKKQIIANMERWRWYDLIPEQDYLLINIPDFKLMVVENQDTALVHKVVVGTVKRKTPILSSYLRTVVLNPTWTIPPTILKEDVVPAMKKNRRYLANKGIQIYDSNNQVVSPWAWNAAAPHNYRYVQGPGPNNTLGEMKILFPNNHSIYLHDTNHKNLFGLNNRSLSSGCIRVEKPLELAGYLLRHSENWSQEKIDSIVSTRITLNIKMEKKYHIHIWYWTAWSENGELQFRRDLYEYDQELYRKLRS